jgi:glycosyltransferase involved in cell wall biosynthesis
MSKKILIISNTSWYLFNFRLSLMKSLQAKGHTLVAVASADEYASRITDAGFSFIPININRKGTNPFEDIVLTYGFYRMFKKEKPDVILTYTPKPNIYASIAARFFEIPVINNVSGLGNVFIHAGLLSAIVTQLYKVAFSISYKVYFQNNDDLQMFIDKGMVNKSTAVRIPGSGVDTAKFIPQAHQRTKKEFIFLLIGRMLWDKGVGEFVEAARILKEKHHSVTCNLVGFVDMQNPQGISKEQIQSWSDEQVISYHGASDDIIGTIATADCIVLPSYREGVSKILLEAASMAKPIITTDAVGCRDAVEDGVTGFLCKTKDSQDLFDKMERMLSLPERERALMGKRGREKMIREFDERFVIQRYIDDIESL